MKTNHKRMSDSITVLYIGVDPGPPDITDVQPDGFGVVTAEDIKEALSILEDTDVDCVVSEHDIPRMDGLELLEEVRKEYPDVPFVLFTKNGSEEVASEAISEGVTDYVQKEGEEGYGYLLDSVRNAVEERRTERELRESEEKYSTLVENANAGVFILQGDEVKFVNSRCAEIFGAEKEEMIGKHPEELIAPEDRQKVMDIYRRRLRGEDVSETHEDRILTVDGETRHIEVNASVITYEGEPASLGVLRDITEQKKRENELGMYKTVVESSPDIIYALNGSDGGREFVMVNEEAERMVGIGEDEVLGENASILIERGVIDMSSLEGVREELQRLYDNEDLEKVQFTSPISTADGERVVENNIATFPIDGEEGLINTVRDITERKRRERELERQNERLEEFASVVSHDLRNPLTVAKGQIELGMRGGDEENFEKAYGALERMDDLIDDVLTLAREGQRVTEKREADLRSIAENGWKNVDTENAHLEVVETDDIRADPDRLCRVFENLFRNATEHNDAGVTVRVGTLEGGFYVEDDGTGIPPDEREDVFEYGYTRGEGTGLGLSIVETIVEAHGWEVSVVESDEGGARFEITE